MGICIGTANGYGGALRALVRRRALAVWRWRWYNLQGFAPVLPKKGAAQWLNIEGISVDMPLILQTFCSGSDGNCALVSDGSTHLLIDAGLTLKNAEAALHGAGISPGELSAILITHEHTDHVRGADLIASRYDVPIYATGATWVAMEPRLVTRTAAKNRIVFDKADDFYIGDINVQPFGIPHDAADPVGYVIFSKGRRIVFATDMGYTNERFVKRAAQADLMVLESNYDPDMLRDGRYPAALKARIAGRKGHLSNQDSAGTMLGCIRGGQVRRFILGHLSRNNNTPQLALRASMAALAQEGLRMGMDIDVTVAPRTTPGERFVL